MKNWKKILIAGLLLLCVLPFAACGEFTGYDDDTVIAKHNGWSTTISTENSVFSMYTFTAQSCNGVNRLRTVTVSEDPEFDMEINVESGRFKIVLIRTSDSKVYVIGSNEDSQVLDTEIPAGTYQFAMVAQKAKVTLFQVFFD